MSDSPAAGFGQFVPGFDFLQNLAKGATNAVPQMPNLANWVAPTLSIEELDKRITELKTVQFWLDQNSKAMGATVQALEVQKMTLATLKGMNFNVGEMANAFMPKPEDPMAAYARKAAAQAKSDAADKATKAEQAEVAARAEADREAAARAEAAAKAQAADAASPKPDLAAAAASLVDPMQLWNSLSQQFQHIAAGAMKDAVQAVDEGRAKPAAKKAAAKAPAVKKGTTKAAPAKAAVKTAAKPASKKAPGRAG